MRTPFTQGKLVFLFALFLAGLVLVCVYFFSISAPRAFPKDTIVAVNRGSGLFELSSELEKKQVIRSPFWFRVAAIALGGERAMKAGDYYMEKPENAFFIAKRIVDGDYQIERVRITIPEGFTVAKISALFDDRFPLFDHEVFESLAPEGYLFPDTYFVPVNSTATSTIKLLRDNFIRKIFPLMPEVELSGRSLGEIITMASIIEAEANNKEDREMISGILWRRIELDIPLQVDASFVYVNGKTTEDLTTDDLKIDSPYNTYLYKGLPPKPISNPGLESILAALNPTVSPYLYFLTGDDGMMYYATNHDKHVQNKQKYLNP